jgi:hypothetical protein
LGPDDLDREIEALLKEAEKAHKCLKEAINQNWIDCYRYTENLNMQKSQLKSKLEAIQKLKQKQEEEEMHEKMNAMLARFDSHITINNHNKGMLFLILTTFIITFLC